MDRDTFILAVYCLVDDHYQPLTATCPLRPGGFTPQLSDVEVITREICGACFKLPCDTALFASFQAHDHYFFPTLTDRTLLVRQAANLGQLTALLQQRLGQQSGQPPDPLQCIAPLPLPVCTYTRGGRRDHGFRPQADSGYCDAKPLHSYGFPLGLRITRCGWIPHDPLLAARPHDIQHLETLGAGLTGGVVAADTGCIDQSRHALLLARHARTGVPPARARMTPTQPSRVRRACARWRKVVETVGSQRTERFAVARIRVRDLWPFQHRLIRKV